MDVDGLQLFVNAAGQRLLRLIQVHSRVPQRAQADTEDEDDEEDYYWGPIGNVEQAGDNWYPKVTEPQPAGVKLLRSGEFGKARNRLGTPRNSNIYSRLRRTALQLRPLDAAANLKHNLIPNTDGTTVATYESNVYVGQFSPGASCEILPFPWLYRQRHPKIRPFTTLVAKVCGTAVRQ